MEKPPRVLLWAAYPLLVYGGLLILEPRYVAGLLCAALLIRNRRAATQLLGGLGPPERYILFALLALSAAAAIANSESLLRLYPVAMNGGMFALFALSLKLTPTMIERFARLEEPELPPAGVRYTRDVTIVWCVFLACQTVAALYTALWTSREVWAFYNAFLTYVFMGTLFAGERLLRRRLIARYV
jgi:uncharacterized membrane protein